MELSQRLSAVASLVTRGASVADVGTDHGYVPIYLAETGRCTHMIAMDINQGPLNRAEEHIREHGLTHRIETRLSDGLKSLKKGEADTMIAAGMGGGLVIKILEEAPELAADIREFILQPQSEIHKVRAYLNQNGFCLAEEKMAEENGKFYPVMKLRHGREPEYTEPELYYGRKLLYNRDKALHRFLIRERQRMKGILRELEKKTNGSVNHRCLEIEKELDRINRGLSYYGDRETGK